MALVINQRAPDEATWVCGNWKSPKPSVQTATQPS